MPALQLSDASRDRSRGDLYGLQLWHQGSSMCLAASMKALPSSLAREVERALRGLCYGTVQLVVHESRVVRIERLERIRLTDSSEATPNTSGQPTPIQGGTADVDRGS